MASDVAAVLGYAQPDKAIRDHCKAAESSPASSAGQVRHVKIIPERDVYRLVMRSKLPGAEAFEEWVVGTVLPSIRKSGGYGAPTAAQPDLSDPASLRTLLLGYTEKVLELEAAVAE
ncbi:Bro-N domain-containing protein [Ralstonia pseudosolanacearum]|uniref:BRO-N domain-containing protein n=1 Tax=Ralstonia pseudosolanacearum TaxID=1310165 RepID=UPI0039C68DFB